MHEGDNLKPFYNLYAIHQGEPEFWPEVLVETKDFVKEALKESADVGCEEEVKLKSIDLSELAGFLRNQNCLEWFLASDFFVKEKHIPWLVNLLKLGYKTAAGFDVSIMESEGYRYVFSEDDIDILKLCAMGSNEKEGSIILRNKILLYDKEEY